MDPIVIIGAGMAAYSVAREFRKHDAVTPLLLVTSDAGRAYAKPMLSNAFALGRSPAQLVNQDAAAAGAQLNANILLHTRVTHLDTAEKTLATTGGPLRYSQLVLALGAQPIRLPLEGDAAADVLSVNHLDDYAELRARLAALDNPARITILGAGLIGCEFADDLSSAGYDVTLVDPNPRLLSALASPGLSRGLARAWEGARVALRLGTVATHVTHHEGAYAVALADGRAVAADIVLSAVGLRANTELARSAGIACGRGITVDANGRTSAPDVFALGDCAEYTTPEGQRVLPYVAPMMAAARAIGATLAGTPTPLAHKPEAVVVKTPSYKMALLPPPQGSEGQWIDSIDGERTVSRFVGTDGVLRGFGLSHHTPALRQSLLAGLGQVSHTGPEEVGPCTIAPIC